MSLNNFYITVYIFFLLKGVVVGGGNYTLKYFCNLVMIIQAGIRLINPTAYTLGLQQKIITAR